MLLCILLLLKPILLLDSLQLLHAVQSWQMGGITLRCKDSLQDFVVKDILLMLS